MDVMEYSGIIQNLKKRSFSSGEEYQKLLTVMGNNYNYEYEETIAIYGYRSNAIACATKSKWDAIFKETIIKEETSGIPIFNRERNRMEVLYDISQIENVNKNPFYRIFFRIDNKDDIPIIIDRLYRKTFGAEIDKNLNQEERLDELIEYYCMNDMLESSHKFENQEKIHDFFKESVKFAIYAKLKIPYSTEHMEKFDMYLNDLDLYSFDYICKKINSNVKGIMGEIKKLTVDLNREKGETEKKNEFNRDRADEHINEEVEEERGHGENNLSFDSARNQSIIEEDFVRRDMPENHSDGRSERDKENRKGISDDGERGTTGNLPENTEVGRRIPGDEDARQNKGIDSIYGSEGIQRGAGHSDEEQNLTKYSEVHFAENKESADYGNEIIKAVYHIPETDMTWFVVNPVKKYDETIEECIAINKEGKHRILAFDDSGKTGGISLESLGAELIRCHTRCHIFSLIYPHIFIICKMKLKLHKKRTLVIIDKIMIVRVLKFGIA